VASATDDERARADQRGVPPPDKDAGGKPTNEDAVLLLLFGLLRSRKVKMRKIDGREEMPERQRKREAA
jgi:hypothetical protein